MKFIPIILIIFFAYACENKTESKKGEIETEIYSSKDFQGDWTLIQKRFKKEKQSIERYKKNAQPDYPREESPPVFLYEDGVLKPSFPTEYLSIENQQLSIQGDSIYSIHYPIHQYWKNNYTIQGNKMFIGENRGAKAVWISDTKDTLRFSYLDFYGLYIEETYLKSSFDDEVLAILNDYNTNFPEFSGTWHLIREEDGEYGERYELDFPHVVPDSIILTREELEATLHTDRSVQMLTDGEYRKYFLGYEDGELLLTPGKWYDMSYYNDQSYSGDQRLFYSRKRQYWEP